MVKQLVILSTNFGTNFSGGTLATHEIFSRIQNQFEKVVFVGSEVGHHEFGHIDFRQCHTAWQIFKTIRGLRNELPNPIFYGDFYLTYLFILAGVPYYFTYHDNWPELRRFGLKYFLQSWYFVPLYSWVIRHADWTFAVSTFKQTFIRRLTAKTSLVRNGTSQPIRQHQRILIGEKFQIVMLGNIDERKYSLATKLFGAIMENQLSDKLEIHIYGHTNNERLTRRLKGFSFVRIHGFSEEIPFENFQLTLSTSFMENLSIAVVESLANHLPVLAFDVGGLNEVVKNGVNGYLIPIGDFRRMLEALERFVNGEVQGLSFDPDLLEEFNWDLASKRYEEVILQSQ